MTWAPTPPGGADFSPIDFDPDRPVHSVFPCEHCEEVCETERAASCAKIEGGWRYLGVPCVNCGRSYTVEVMRDGRA